MVPSTCIDNPESPTRPVRVFVVDDHAHYRSLVEAVVDAAEGFELVGWASSLAEVQAAFAEAGLAEAGLAEAGIAEAGLADLVLMDVHLGDDSGVDVSRWVRERSPSTEVVLISTAARDELPPGAADCGARGYLPKAKVSPRALAAAWVGAYDW